MQTTDQESKKSTFTLYAKNSQNVKGVSSSVNYPKNDSVNVSVNQNFTPYVYGAQNAA